MIKWGLSVLLILSIQSWVKASVVDRPENCFAAKKYPCSLRSPKDSLRFERAAVTYVLGEKSSIKFLAEDRIQVLEGRLWIEKGKALQVMVHPQFEFEATGDVFLQKTSDGSLLVRNLDAQIRFQSRSVFRNESLPVGFQNWYGRLNSQKQIDRGVLRPIEMAAFLKVWIPVSSLSMAELKSRVIQWKQQWAGAIEDSVGFYREVVERRIASAELQDQRRASKQKAAQDEQNRIRQLYRQKTGFEQ